MELLIKNGEIVDGSGDTSYIADIYVKDGIIKDIGMNIEKNLNNSNITIIDAKGLVVSAGFIDMHSHSDALYTCDTSSEEKLQQGVTTEVNGNCGFGLFPIPKQEKVLDQVINDLVAVEFYVNKDDIKWREFNDFCEYFNDKFGTNQVPLVPHSMIRSYVTGINAQNVSLSDIESMEILLDRQLKLGAWGMSTGLAYAPGCFSNFKELVSLCKVLKNNDKLYVTHSRDEGDYVIDSVDEVIKLAKESGCKAHISHLKAIGKTNHNKTYEIINKIKNARNDGINITADIYPYEASSTILGILLPKETRMLSINDMLDKLQDKEYLQSINDDVMYNLNNRGGSEKIVINFMSYKYDVDIVGKSIKEIASIFGLTELETVYKLIVDNKNVINAIYYVISTDSIEKLLQEDFTAIGSDGMLNRENKSASHPRTFGTFTKVLSSYVRDKQVISLEKAVYKMSKLPATILGLQNRGEIKVGNFADINIFNKYTVKDNSTFADAYKYSTGIECVIVNGEIAYKNNLKINDKSGIIIKDSK